MAVTRGGSKPKWGVGGGVASKWNEVMVSRKILAEIWVALSPSELHSSKISAIILRTGLQRDEGHEGELPRVN